MADHEDLQFSMDGFEDFDSEILELSPPLSPLPPEVDSDPPTEFDEEQDEENDILEEDNYVWASSAMLQELRRTCLKIQSYNPESDPDQASLSALLSEILQVTSRARKCLDILTDQLIYTDNPLIHWIILDEKSRVLCWYQKLLDTQMVAGLCRYSNRLRRGEAVWPPSCYDIFTK